MTRQTGIVLMLAVLGLVLDATAAAENWPCFRGPTRQGISRETNIPTQWSATAGLAWTQSIPGQGWSSPIVQDERVYVTTATEEGVSLRLICLDRKDGRLLWNKEVIRQKAGHKSRQNSYATSTPATDGKHVYIVACDGTILATSMDGDVQWINRDFDYYSEHGLSVSPVLHEDRVMVAFDWSSRGPDKKVGWQIPWDKAVILAADTATGKTLWRGTRGSSRVAHVTPQVVTVNGRAQLVSSAGDVIQGFDVADGQRLWTVSSPGEGVVPSVVAGAGLVFTASGFGDSAIRAVRPDGRGDVTATHVAWELKEDVPKVASMLYVAPYLYLITDSGTVKCLEADSGQEVWRHRLGGKFTASPVYADGKIYCLSEKGTTTVIESGGAFKAVAENELGQTCEASPAIAYGHLFIRTDQTLFCIGAQ